MSLQARIDDIAARPYRFFFPLGMLLAWWGVSHWLLWSLGMSKSYQAAFHSIAQVQGFLMCFAVGFLLTAIPRRTGTSPPSTWEVVIGASAPVISTISAYFGAFAVSQMAWLLLIAMLVVFALRRFLSSEAKRRPPNSFIWVPLSLLVGAVGSILTAAYGIIGDEAWWYHELGKKLVLQGVFLGLIIGVGGMALPLMTRGESSTDAARSPRDFMARSAHLMMAVSLLTSFLVEMQGWPRWGFFMRGTIVLIMLLVSARIHRLPNQVGGHRWLIWLAAWCIPLGYLLAGLFPARQQAGLHVVFVGGFAMMAMAVGIHVILAHGGYKPAFAQLARHFAAFGILMLFAAFARFLVLFDPARHLVWTGVAAAFFLAATLHWLVLTIPRLAVRSE